MLILSNSGNKTLEWVEEIRGRMSQKLQGYNQKLIAFGSSMSETLGELTNALGKYFIFQTPTAVSISNNFTSWLPLRR